MKKQHYPDIERCKKLTEIGFPETENCISNLAPVWNYEETYIADYAQSKHFSIDSWERVPNYKDSKKYICPSAMEMLDVMPEYLKDEDRNLAALEILNPQSSSCELIWVETEGAQKRFQNHEYIAGTLPNALADMILWLHSEGHITFR